VSTSGAIRVYILSTPLLFLLCCCSATVAGSTQQARRCSSGVQLRALPEAAKPLDIEQVADIIAAQPLDDDRE
jgi:hypothetical protein